MQKCELAELELSNSDLKTRIRLLQSKLHPSPTQHAHFEVERRGQSRLSDCSESASNSDSREQLSSCASVSPTADCEPEADSLSVASSSSSGSSIAPTPPPRYSSLFRSASEAGKREAPKPAQRLASQQVSALGCDNRLVPASHVNSSWPAEDCRSAQNVIVGGHQLKQQPQHQHQLLLERIQPKLEVPQVVGQQKLLLHQPHLHHANQFESAGKSQAQAKQQVYHQQQNKQQQPVNSHKTSIKSCVSEQNFTTSQSGNYWPKNTSFPLQQHFQTQQPKNSNNKETNGNNNQQMEPRIELPDFTFGRSRAPITKAIQELVMSQQLAASGPNNSNQLSVKPRRAANLSSISSASMSSLSSTNSTFSSSSQPMPVRAAQMMISASHNRRLPLNPLPVQVDIPKVSFSSIASHQMAPVSRREFAGQLMRRRVANRASRSRVCVVFLPDLFLATFLVRV